ncbi:MAG: DUF1499 domain-containing protein [Halioglobus sp.]
MQLSRSLAWLPLCFLCACSSMPDRPAPGATLLPCGPLPHCVSSTSTRPDQAIAPLTATAQQWQQLKQWLATQEHWTITEDTGDFLQAVVSTPLLHFQDDVQLLYDQHTGVVQVRSSSRLGISDLGTNRRRVELLRDHLAADPGT